MLYWTQVSDLGGPSRTSDQGVMCFLLKYPPTTPPHPPGRHTEASHSRLFLLYSCKVSRSQVTANLAAPATPTSALGPPYWEGDAGPQPTGFQGHHRTQHRIGNHDREAQRSIQSRLTASSRDGPNGPPPLTHAARPHLAICTRNAGGWGGQEGVTIPSGWQVHLETLTSMATCKHVRLCEAEPRGTSGPAHHPLTSHSHPVWTELRPRPPLSYSHFDWHPM